jgi:putative phosphoribosyl transferase
MAPEIERLEETAGHLVRVPAGAAVLEGNLEIPEGATGIVLFAHGSGSSRYSPRNRAVARTLQVHGLGTLLLDLLTPDEEMADHASGRLRFDIDLLAERLIGATDWLHGEEPTRKLRVGYFGASTGAGAAIVAAAQRPNMVRAVVSRGGRPDLAGSALTRVRVPTLLIVGGEDRPVLAMNQTALEKLPGKKRLEIIPGATHLFEEPGALEEVARLAAAWFLEFLAPSGSLQEAAGKSD